MTVKSGGKVVLTRADASSTKLDFESGSVRALLAAPAGPEKREGLGWWEVIPEGGAKSANTQPGCFFCL